MRIEVDARRVALLARAGIARERLSTVLDEAGALCVLAADPTDLDPAALLELELEVVVVALDPLIEEVLEQFDAILGDPSIEVIYEEAEHAANREGWDAARWQRHLVAKLQGHANVLPPSRVSSAALAVDVATTAAPVDQALPPALATAESPVLARADGAVAGQRSDDPMLSQGLAETPAGAMPELLLESIALEMPVDALSATTGHVAAADSGPPQQDVAVSDFDFSLDLAGDDRFAADAGSGFSAFDPVNAETAPETGAVPDSGFAFTLDDLDGALAGSAIVPRPELSLLDDAVDTPVSQRVAPRDGLAALHGRASTLELVDDAPRRQPQQPQGAVLILSGLGGPDAVRQLLGALPQGFTRPVLVRQHLDGGRYDRLVTQLQRATALPVELAQPELPAMPGTVYILPDAVGATASEAGMRFSGDASETVLAALPSADSAVLLLSGSDPAHLDAVMTHSEGGALVAGQTADGCYDPVASNALAARGGDVASPAALALRLRARWPNQGSSNVEV